MHTKYANFRNNQIQNNQIHKTDSTSVFLS